MISDSQEKGRVLWMGARLYEPEGEEMSAYGLDYNHKGVATGNSARTLSGMEERFSHR